MIDAIARASGAGWSTVTLADGRPMALHRTRSGASLAIGCRGDGVLVVAGGPAPIVRLVSEEDEEIVPVAVDRVALRGARNLVEVLRSEGNPAGHQLFVGAEEILVAEASSHVAPMAEHCAARLARSSPPEADTRPAASWIGANGTIGLAVRGDDTELRFTCDAATRRLTIYLAGAPQGARAGQQTTIVIATPTGALFLSRPRPAQSGRVARAHHSGGRDDASALLNALSTEDGFATGLGNTIDMVRPGQGLAGLIERRRSPPVARQSDAILENVPISRDRLVNTNSYFPHLALGSRQSNLLRRSAGPAPYAAINRQAHDRAFDRVHQGEPGTVEGEKLARREDDVATGLIPRDPDLTGVAAHREARSRPECGAAGWRRAPRRPVRMCVHDGLLRSAGAVLASKRFPLDEEEVVATSGCDKRWIFS